jgi:HNH endonuclease
MSDPPTNFDTSHNEAFRALGARNPSQHWSAFDVRRPQARAGKAKRFVTTIWNFQRKKVATSRRMPTEQPAIARDKTDGTLWYRVARPPADNPRKTHVAHWDGLELALAKRIPIVGVLKDAHSKRCSLEHVFDGSSHRDQVDGSAIWLQLRPRGQVGCEVTPVDIHKLTVSTWTQLTERFEKEVREAQRRSPSQRQARLANARRLPRPIEVTTTVFYRNADVVAEVLSRADGLCEGCTKSAPFVRRTNGLPYLEVHHRVHLADGGEDTVENAVALCPNCHRAEHYA